jgi:hypothetical protein
MGCCLFRRIFISLLMLLSATIFADSARNNRGHFLICGKVTSGRHEPVGGAYITARADNIDTAITVTDSLGRYSIELSTDTSRIIRMNITAIGHTKRQVQIMAIQDTTIFNVVLDEKAIELGTIVVRPSSNMDYLTESLAPDKISSSSNCSIVPTDPMAAIRQPQVVRYGSAQSSKIRVSGTSPMYYLNGIEMGFDPNHYGLFSIIASPALSEIRFQSHGTDAAFGTPSVLEFETSTFFEKHAKGELNLSFVEATGAFSTGNSRYFAQGLVRQSVLDKVAEQVNLHSNRLTLPPTSFRDIFVSSGLRLSGRFRLFTDQYYSQDYLSYNLSPTRRNPKGIKASQRTNQNAANIRLEANYPHAIVKVSGAYRTYNEAYNANSQIGRNNTGLFIDLHSNSHIGLANIQTIVLLGKVQLEFGNNLNYVTKSKIDLEQINWNFLPPDASSDNPYIFQNELNNQYGSYHSSSSRLADANYLTFRGSINRFGFETGIRGQYYEFLATKWKTLYRHSIDFQISRKSKVGFFYGTFAESPETRILEPYQVMVDSDIRSLKPIETKLLSARYSYDFLEFGIFKKAIKNQPIPLPNVFITGNAGGAESGKIVMFPIGKIEAYGADISVDIKEFISPRLSLSMSYGYSREKQIIAGYVFPYELNAPHKVFAKTQYQVSHAFSCGASFSGRSGYPYTPPITAIRDSSGNSGDFAYYIEYWEKQYSKRFPTNISANLFANLSFGKSQAYLSISNFTNHKNPIISTADGFIYDTGILPSIGFKYNF